MAIVSLAQLPKASALHQAAAFRGTAEWNMSETNIKQSGSKDCHYLILYHYTNLFVRNIPGFWEKAYNSSQCSCCPPRTLPLSTVEPHLHSYMEKTGNYSEPQKC